MKKFSAIVKVFLISILLSVNCFANDFLRRATDENSYISGEYQLFSKRGSPANINSSFSVSPSNPVRTGNISIDHQGFKGYVRHTSEFGGHGWQVHSPFSNSSSLSLDDLSGSLLINGSSHNKLSVSAIEKHLGKDYDGPQGGGFPKPKGARDRYSYGISGSVVTVKVISLERVNNALPNDRKLTEREVDLIQNGRKIPEERIREITAIAQNLNPTEILPQETPSLVSQVLEKSSIAIDQGRIYFKEVGEFAVDKVGGSLTGAAAGLGQIGAETWESVRHPIETATGLYNFARADNKPELIKEAALNYHNSRIDDIETFSAVNDSFGESVATAKYTTEVTFSTLTVLNGAGELATLARTGKTAEKIVKSADNFAEGVGKSSTKIEPITSEGTANAATYPKLKEDLKQQNLDNIAAQDPRLASTIEQNGYIDASGNIHEKFYNIGSATRAESDNLGQIWVGDGATLNSKGTGLVSADGTRGYRFPAEKTNTPSKYNPTGTQANFESYEVDTIIKPDGTEKLRKRRTGDGHLNIID